MTALSHILPTPSSMQFLNTDYRQHNQLNVLTFPFLVPENINEKDYVS